MEALEGLDTLAVHLLTMLGNTAQLERLLSGSNAADLDTVAPALERQGQWHALALLKVSQGYLNDAVRIWKVRVRPIFHQILCSRTAHQVLSCVTPATLSSTSSTATGSLSVLLLSIKSWCRFCF